MGDQVWSSVVSHKGSSPIGCSGPGLGDLPGFINMTSSLVLPCSVCLHFKLRAELGQSYACDPQIV